MLPTLITPPPLPLISFPLQATLTVRFLLDSSVNAFDRIDVTADTEVTAVRSSLTLFSLFMGPRDMAR